MPHRVNCMAEWGEKPESSGFKSSSEAVLKLTVVL